MYKRQGFGGKIIQHIVGNASGLDGGFGQGEQPALFNAFVGEQGHPASAAGAQNGGDVVHGVLSAVYGVRHFQIVRGEHKNLLSFSGFGRR